MVIQTRVILGTSETPSFVSKEFYDVMHLNASVYQYDYTLRPDSIEYKIPAHMVVERFQARDRYSIFVTDTVDVPFCMRKTCLDVWTFVHKTPKYNFDRFRVYTEDVDHHYFLLTPNARYYDTVIYKNTETRHLIHNNILWDVTFREVYVDPHDTRQTLWFFSHPKYQVELSAEHDFRKEETDLKIAIMAILPNTFR
jgi:hypothetical protein